MAENLREFWGPEERMAMTLDESLDVRPATRSAPAPRRARKLNAEVSRLEELILPELCEPVLPGTAVAAYGSASHGVGDAAADTAGVPRHAA